MTTISTSISAEIDYCTNENCVISWVMFRSLSHPLLKVTSFVVAKIRRTDSLNYLFHRWEMGVFQFGIFFLIFFGIFFVVLYFVHSITRKRGYWGKGWKMVVMVIFNFKPGKFWYKSTDISWQSIFRRINWLYLLLLCFSDFFIIK